MAILEGRQTKSRRRSAVAREARNTFVGLWRTFEEEEEQEGEDEEGGGGGGEEESSRARKRRPETRWSLGKLSKKIKI